MVQREDSSKVGALAVSGSCASTWPRHFSNLRKGSFAMRYLAVLTGYLSRMYSESSREIAAVRKNKVAAVKPAGPLHSACSMLMHVAV